MQWANLISKSGLVEWFNVVLGTSQLNLTFGAGFVTDRIVPVILTFIS